MAHYRELLSLYILEILTDHSNKDKKMSQDKILDFLLADYGIDVERKTLGKYNAALREEGHLAGKRGVYRKNNISDQELRILIDSILFAPYIPAQEAKTLIDKLKAISPVTFKNKLRHVHYVQDFSRTENQDFYRILDNIDEAIEARRKVEITVFRHNEHAEREDVQKDIIHPYYIVNSNARYYVICYAGRGNRLESRRIDKISKVKILPESIEPLRSIIGKRQNFDLGQYMREHIYMFSGDSERIKLKMKKIHIDYFIEWYGKNYQIVDQDQDYITIRVKANVNATYYWALQYGHLVEVIEPISLREKVKQGLIDILQKYE